MSCNHMILTILLILLSASNVIAIQVAPRITDKEIIERLARLEEGQKALNKRIDDLNKQINNVEKRLNRRIDDVKNELNKRIDDVNSKLSDLFNLTLVLFTALITLIAGLFGYIIWDRHIMMKPLQAKVESLEKIMVRELEVENKDASLPARLINALRELAKTDEKLAAILRSFALF